MRGVAGGTLLGGPLVYTQEVWSHGASMHPYLILALLALTFAVTAALSSYVGFERAHRRRPIEDAVIGMGVSLLLASALLAMLNRITPTMPLHAVAGIVALTTIPVSIGFAIGNALAPRRGGEGAERMTGTAGDLTAAAGGTIVFVLNIAPTEEPILLAGELTPVHLIVLVAASLVLPYLIVFYAEFGGKERRRASDGATQTPLNETILAYGVAFVLCAGLLAAFGRLEQIDATSLSEVVVLAFPGSLGGALGRMLV